ncbi:hypothetical protein ACEXQE_02260 [Herbiconiux sp. P17]|uniref:hypothetical protein n=1 Tax=Herbiconiux wuyangfengii TaxID=3342794 RepID=UPI0035B7F3C9
MSDTGPEPGLRWVIGDEERVWAKQADMVSIDVRFAIRWVTTMQGLVDQELDDKEFTKRRMEELALWTKDRKREGHNIHYRYDPRRRNPRLVDREVRRMNEKIAGHVAAFKELERLAQAPHPVAIEAPRPPVARVQKRASRDLSKVPKAAVEMISKDTGIGELQRASDEAILQAYMTRRRLPRDKAQHYVDLLNGGSSGVSPKA